MPVPTLPPPPMAVERIDSFAWKEWFNLLYKIVYNGGSGSLAAHLAAADPHTGYQKESEKNTSGGYAGLNSSTRTTKGVDTTDDVVIDLATSGLVLKDTQGTPHYWRVTISTTGALVTTDLGTTKP